MKALLRRLLLAGCLLALLGLSQLSACASSSGDQFHSFHFDVRTENPDIEVLDYRYGEVRIGPTQADRSSVERGLVRQQAGVTGYIPRGETLYVKWRIRATGEVREETVDLKNRLPRDISNQVITFNFKQGNLYVYLVSREVLPVGQKSDGPRLYDIYKVYTIYPDSRANLPS